ncbi:MAG: aspartate kinase [Candidatus Cloacimonadaceae bacterium]
MAIIVKKFGGTSVGSIERIKHVAHKIAAARQPEDQIVIVVSAMGKTTDELFQLAYQITNHPSRRELDMLLTAGERITMSLLSLALHEEGLSSISFTGSQSGIITDDSHGNAKIIKVNAFRIQEELAKDKIVIVAGFQGVSLAKEVTTLGRGGSDTTAVALASYLQADSCEIYTDVDGVFTADPKLVDDPILLPVIDYDEMLALAYSGSRVLHPRAVEFAMKYKIPVEVKSSFTFAPGTLVKLTEENYQLIIKEIKMEDRVITAIAHKTDLIRYRLEQSDRMRFLMKNWTNEIFKYEVHGNQIDLYIEAFYAPEIDNIFRMNDIKPIEKTPDLGYVTMVGLSINLDLPFLNEILDLTGNLNIERITHSERTIEILLPTANVETCVQTLHNKYIKRIG